MDAVTFLYQPSDAKTGTLFQSDPNIWTPNLHPGLCEISRDASVDIGIN